MTVRLVITYGDHNTALEAVLPKTGIAGTVVRPLRFTNWSSEWFLVALDRSFHYDGRTVSQVVIASRWRDHPVGGVSPTSVFLLLPPPEGIAVDGPLDPQRFVHVAWCMATLESQVLPSGGVFPHE